MALRPLEAPFVDEDGLDGCPAALPDQPGAGGEVGVVVPPVDGLDWEAWYGTVVRHEIAPLLDEYWFDAPSKAHQQNERLRER